MGSDSSKQNIPNFKQPNQAKEEDSGKFQYGPKRTGSQPPLFSPAQGRSEHTLKEWHTLVNATSDQHQPRPHSSDHLSNGSQLNNHSDGSRPRHHPDTTFPRQLSYDNANTNLRTRPAAPAPIPSFTSVKPVAFCKMCKGNHSNASACPQQSDYFSNQMHSHQSAQPIPQTPRKNSTGGTGGFKSPYKWTSEKALNVTQQQPSPKANYGKEPQSTPLKVNAAIQKIPTPKQSPLPSPIYDPSGNIFVWHGSRSPADAKAIRSVPAYTKPRKVMDLDHQLPIIIQQIKLNQLPSFKYFNKLLNKNKPLAETRKAMVNDKYLSDVQFYFGDSVLYAHKMPLITASMFFYEHFHVNGEQELKVDSVDPEAFMKVVTYCYTDQIDVSEENVLELLLVSNKYQVRQVTNVCHGFISNMMNADSIFLIFEKALELEYELFQKKCLDYINKNEEKCFASKGFFGISLPTLMKILEICKYPREKSSEICEKWTNGGLGLAFDAPPLPTPKPQAQQSFNMPPPPTPKPQQPPTVKPNKPNCSSPNFAAKKFPPKKNQPNKPNNEKQSMSIPDLRTINTGLHSGPPMVTPFPNVPYQMPYPQYPNNYEAYRPFAAAGFPNPPMGELINFDDEDDRDSIISKDDERTTKIKFNVFGKRQQWETEFSRLDFVCKRSMLIHEIWFSEDLAPKCKKVELTVSVFEMNKRSDIHIRTIVNNNKPGMKIRFVKFHRDPLKLYVGQKFFIKLNFSDSTQRLNINAESLHSEAKGPNNIVELRRDAETKTYFNCISSLVVSEMPST